MTLYLDTSSLVKLYVAESESDSVRQLSAAGKATVRFSCFDSRLTAAARSAARTARAMSRRRTVRASCADVDIRSRSLADGHDGFLP